MATTVNGDINITGNVDSSGGVFSGDGSGLTNITAGGGNADTLGGELPAFYLDYDNFTNTPVDFDTQFAGKSTTDLSEGTNLYYTDARFDTRFNTKSTSNLTEGSNLYYTNARVDARVTKSFVDALGVRAAEADTLTNARDITLAGDVSGTASFDGSSNITITTTIDGGNHTHDIADINGLQTELDSKLNLAGGTMTGDLFMGIGDRIYGRSGAGGGVGIISDSDFKISLSTNDGFGNSNLTFNHHGATPAITGTAARIDVGTDGPSGKFSFDVGEATAGVQAAITTIATLDRNLTTLSSETEIVTRQRGDLRYLQIADAATDFVPVAGGTFTGVVNLSNDVTNIGNSSVAQMVFGATASPGFIQLSNADVGSAEAQLTIRDTNSLAIAKFGGAGSTMGDSKFVITREKGDARYLQIGDGASTYLPLAGGTLTGTLVMNYGSPLIQFIESDENPGSGSGSYTGITTTGNSLFMQHRAYPGGPATNFLQVQYVPETNQIDNWLFRQGTSNDIRARMDYSTSTDLPSNESLVTRTRGDNRYLRLVGGDISGSLNVQAPSDFWTSTTKIFVDDVGGLFTNGSNRLSLLANGYRKNDTTWTSFARGGKTGAAGIELDGSGRILFQTETVKPTGSSFSIDTVAEIDYEIGDTTLPTALSIVTRERGDARYLQTTDAANEYLPLTGGTLTGLLTVDNLSPGFRLTPTGDTSGTSFIEIGNGRTMDGTSYIDLISDSTYSDYGTRLRRYSGENGETRLEHRGTGAFRFQAHEASDFIFSRSGTSVASIGATLSADESVVTRSLGDARYLQITDAANEYLPLTGGDIVGDVTVDGELSTTGRLIGGTGTTGGVGVLSGSDYKMSMVTNDGYGNSNLTFNHHTATPAVTGTAARIEVNTDAAGGKFTFSVGTATAGVKADIAAVASLDQNLTTLSSTTEIVTRQRGDARYLQSADAATTYLPLTGGTLSDDLRISGTSSTDTNIYIINQSATQTSRIGQFNGGTLFLRYDHGGANQTDFTFDHELASTTDVVTRAQGDIRYAQLSGATFTGDVVLTRNSLASLKVKRGSGGREWGIGTVGDSAAMSVYDVENDTVAARFDEAGTGTPGTATVITREKGDARYAKLSGAEFTDSVTMGAGQNYVGNASDSTLNFLRTNGPSFLDAENSGNTLFRFRDDSETGAAEIERAGTSAPNALTVVTREKGDARYAQLDGAEFAGSVTMGAGQNYVGNASGSTLNFLRTNGTAYIDTARTNTTGDQITFRNADDDTIGIIRGSDTPTPKTLMTREKGDARYLQLSDYGVDQTIKGNLYVEDTGDAILSVKSLGGGSDDDALLVLDAAGTGGESVLSFRNDGVSKAIVEWYNTDNHMNITTFGDGSYIDLQPDNKLTMRVLENSSSGRLVSFYDSSGSSVGHIGSQDSDIWIGEGQVALQFQLTGTDRIDPFDSDANAVRDNAIDLGGPSSRFDDIYATNGVIQTSDRNEKMDIEAISEAEARVAKACKGLLRKFRWKDAVEEKGEEARIHFGIIAQDLRAAFEAEGLDAGDYAMFTSTTWWEFENKIIYDAAEAPEGSAEKTRLGVRYPELLAFIISAI